MICPACQERRHGECRGGTWCDCQHQRAGEPRRRDAGPDATGAEQATDDARRDERAEPGVNWLRQG